MKILSKGSWHWWRIYSHNWGRCWLVVYSTSSHLTHRGRVTHICHSYQTIIGSDNGLWPVRHQAIIWTNARMLWIEHLGTNFSEISIEIYILLFKKMHSICRLRNGVHFVSAPMSYMNWYQYWGHCCLINDLGSSPQPKGCGELPRSLMRQQWPKLRYQFLFYHNETKLMMNKQILSI